MRSVSYRLADLNRVTVPLGFRGENEHTRVIIDCKKAFDEYPRAIPSLAVKNPDGTAYPAVIVREGDLVYWNVRDSDLVKEGRGTAQLTFTEDGVVRKDDIFNTVIGKSILPAGPAPDPIADWITEANTVLGEIPATIAESVENALEEANKADKTDTVLNTTLSRGRKPNSTVGDGSIAFGYVVEASGLQSVGFGSLIEAKGDRSFAHGYEVVARGDRSSAGGYGTIAQGANSDVSGMYNVADSYENWPDWQPNTFYDAKDKIHLQVQSGGETYDYYYICKTPHTSGTTWDSHSSYWDYDNGYMNYAHIVGNGKDYRHRSNAYALDWEGNGHYAGDVYVGCDADGSGGVKLEPVVFATDSEIQDIIDDWEVSE